MNGPQIKNITKENLKKLYVDNPSATLESVGKILGCNKEAIRRWLIRYDLPVKSKSRSNVSKKPSTRKLIDKEWLRRELETKTAYKIGKELNTDVQNVVYWAKSHGLWKTNLSLSERIKDGLRKAFPNGSFGENSSHWKGGRVERGGYVLVYSPNHPNKSSSGYVQEHRLVVEKKLGRYLEKNEIVHHKNGIKNDNRAENLEVVRRGEHVSNHFKASHEVLSQRERIAELEKEIERLKNR